jgi:hypothetical protein
LKKWAFNVHNFVNKKLNKKQYSYTKFKNNTIIPDNENIFIILKAIYKNFNYDIMSFYKYDQIYNFFLNFCILYPDQIIKEELKKMLIESSFKKVLTPKEFKIWLFNNLMNMQKIFCNKDNRCSISERKIGFLSNVR